MTTTSHSETRLAVADILSTMASGEAITPSTFAALEGFSTGVLTQTTPTLTPTTLRSIEQTFIELQNVPPPHQVSHQNEAGFVPPVVHAVPASNSPPAAAYQAPQPPTEPPSWNGRAAARSTAPKPGGGRHMGGRRPAKYEKLTPEEEERRRVRRERNKLAAARCRKRRMDHTNNLICETEGLEEQRSSLQSEIQDLQNQRDELEFLLEAHKVVCKLQKQHHHHHHQHQQQHDDEDMDVKPDLSELNLALTGGRGAAPKKPQPLQRPNSLPLSSSFAVPNPPTMVPSAVSKLSLTEATGIAISTPSNGIFNFEALMEGGTGLTPVTSAALAPIIPTCSTQQRSSSSDLSSPDTITPPKLVSL